MNGRQIFLPHSCHAILSCMRHVVFACGVAALLSCVLPVASWHRPVNAAELNAGTCPQADDFAVVKALEGGGVPEAEFRSLSPESPVGETRKDTPAYEDNALSSASFSLELIRPQTKSRLRMVDFLIAFRSQSSKCDGQRSSFSVNRRWVALMPPTLFSWNVRLQI